MAGAETWSATRSGLAYGAAALVERILLHALVDKRLLPQMPTPLPKAPPQKVRPDHFAWSTAAPTNT